VSEATTNQLDDVLRPFLQTANEPEAERLLARLLAEHAEPVINGIVKSTFGRSAATSELARERGDTQDVEDIVGDVNTKVLDRLRRLKSAPHENVIGDFRGYVAVAAHNACHTYLRGKYPNRTRLKNKLRYVLSHHAEFAVWESRSGEWICGFSSWKTQGVPPLNIGWINQARMDPGRYVEVGSPDDTIGLLRAVFRGAHAPIRVEDLVSLAADILNVKDRPAGTEFDGESQRVKNLAGKRVDPVDEAGQRLYLERVWKEIVQLPLPQRVALLLGLRDEERRSVTILLSDIRIATFREIAEVVGMSALDFASIAKDLPLDDQAIAKRLGASRQQVISYRLSARRRLARRIQSFDENER
jgi:hypothetical protein